MVLGAGIEPCSILSALIWGRKTNELYSMDKIKAVGTIWEGVPCLRKFCERANRLQCEKRRKTKKKTGFLLVEYSLLAF